MPAILLFFENKIKNNNTSYQAGAISLAANVTVFHPIKIIEISVLPETHSALSLIIKFQFEEWSGGNFLNQLSFLPPCSEGDIGMGLHPHGFGWRSNNGCGWEATPWGFSSFCDTEAPKVPEMELFKVFKVVI